MNDVAQILGDTESKGQRLEGSTSSTTQNPSKAMKITGMSKEVMDLLSGKQDSKSAALPPIVPTFSSKHEPAAPGGDTAVKVKVGSKWISSDKPARKWAWAPFASSSRTDGAIFHHWVRANVEYTDYPYAKFDIHLDPVTYSTEEYTTYLKSDRWTKSETDYLMDLARIYELRWPVIHDRWFDFYHSQQGANSVSRTVDDLQQRYYTVATILSQVRISKEAAAEAQTLSATVPEPTAPKEKTEALLLETAAARALASSNVKNQPLINNVGTGSSNKMFDTVHERERRLHLDRLWNRSKEEELEEIELRKELKIIETQLRKLKKQGGHVLAAAHGAAAAAPSSSRISSAASSRNPSRSVSPVPGAAIAESPAILDKSFSSTAPIPMPQNPYFQSGRLVPPATGGAAGLNRTLLNKMDQTLAELKVSSTPIPTKRVCDLYDTVRKDVLTLLTLQKMVMQKEGNLQAKRAQLSKLRGGEGPALDEETLLGIAPPPTSSANIASTTTSKSSKSSKGGKSKASGRTKAGSQKGKADDAGGKGDAKDGTKKKAAPKRKRKSEAKSQSPTPGSAAAPGGTAATTPAGVPTPIAAKSGKATPSATGGNSASKQSTAKKRARKS